MLINKRNLFIFLQPRQNLLSAANQIGEASQDILKQVGGDVDADSKEFEVCSSHYRNKCVVYRTEYVELHFRPQDLLLALAKAVANTTATLVLKAKGVAGTTQEQDDKNRVIGSATACALATSQLVACTKVRAHVYGVYCLMFTSFSFHCRNRTLCRCNVLGGART